MPVKLGGGKQDLNSYEGLYDLSVDSGLQKQADDIVIDNSGDDVKKIFSGGVISNIFDAISIDSYAVVGMLKGKSAWDGIENRESFSDKDAMGQFGLTGVIAGTLMDIAVTPTTYIAPWTIAKKIPGLSRAAKAVKEVGFGKMVEKEVNGVKFMEHQGGTKVGNFVAEKLIFGYGVDPVVRETFEQGQREAGIGMVKIQEILKPLAQFDDSIASKLLTRGDDFRFNRKSIDELQHELSEKDFAIVKPVWDKIDSMGKEMTELGLLGKGKYEENLGTYIKNVYATYEEAKGKNKIFSKKNGVTAQKSRVEGLTAEQMKAAGQIENPAYLLRSTMLSMSNDIANARMLRNLKPFVSETELPGFTKLVDSKRLQISQGAVAESAQKLEVVNDKIEKIHKELQHTAKADKAVVSKIKAIQKQYQKTIEKQMAQYNEFMNYGAKSARVVETPRKLGIIPEHLQPIASLIKKSGKSYDEFLASSDGVKLEKAFVMGDMNRYNSMEEFFNAVKNPYTPASKGVAKAKGVEPEIVFDRSVKFERDSDLVSNVKYWFGKAEDAIGAAKAGKKMGIPEKRKMIVNELNNLRTKIKTLKKGFKAGVKAGGKQIDAVQGQLIKTIEKNFDLKDRGKFLTKVKNATTPAKLDKIIDSVEETFRDILESNVEMAGAKSLRKAMVMQERARRLLQKSTDLTELDKRSINNSFINLEKTASDLKFQKEDLLHDIENSKLGDLSGKYMPEQMAKMLDGIIGESAGKIESRIVGAFKYSKVVLSPAAAARNMISNMTLNWWKLGIPPYRLDLYADAFMDVFVRKEKSEIYKRAEDVGLNASTFASQELNFLIDGVEGQGAFGKVTGAARRVKETIGNIYQGEESMAKLVAFKQALKKGMSDEDAWKQAESATFNYAQVTPFIRRLRSSIWGAPFITFSVKALPVALGAISGKGTGLGSGASLFTSTSRVAFFQRVRQALNSLNDDKETKEEYEQMPSYMRDGFYVKLPWKDEHDRSMYFDLTYIIPFGDLLGGNVFNAKQDPETGLKQNVAQDLIANFPALQAIVDIGKNKDFVGNKIVKETGSGTEKTQDIAEYLIKFLAPPVAGGQIGVGYKEDGTPVEGALLKSLRTDADPKQSRTLSEELLSYIGAKVRPFDAEQQRAVNDWNRKKGLRQLLIDNNIVKEYSSSYIPKE